MKSSWLKLKFTVSRNTDFDNLLIRRRIKDKLTSKNYVILESNNNCIRFGRHAFEFVWNYQAPYILDGGKFQIDKLSEDKTVVSLSYFINTFYSFLKLSIIIIAVLIQGEHIIIWFFILFFTIASIFQYFTTKSVGKNLLNDILTKED